MRIAECHVSEFVDVSVQRSAINNAGRHCIRVLAKTKPQKAITRWAEQHPTIDNCDWTGRWWARLIRWLHARRWLGKFIPYPLLCLANASHVTWSNDYFTLPEAALDSIGAQIADIKSSGRDAVVILIGREAFHQLHNTLHFSMFPAAYQLSESGYSFYGLPMIVTPKLEPNSVIVV